jgi:alkylation response protein AidB-like acyl-CoA dehydrogenase
MSRLCCYWQRRFCAPTTKPLKPRVRLAANAREHAGKRDLQRKLPWSLVEEFTRSGLGSLSIAREFGGPQVSFVTLAEVFAIISAADPALGQIPQNQVGHSQPDCCHGHPGAKRTPVRQRVARLAHRQCRPRTRQ